MRAVLDTNILIDYLAGMYAAREEIERYRSPGISLVTWLEVMAGARGGEEEISVRRFLARFDVQPISLAVAEEASRIRLERRMRLADALIWATARAHGRLLVTRNTRDFPRDDPGVRVPYDV